MSVPEPLRVLIADDEPLARELLASMLSDLPGVEVIGESTNGKEAAAFIQRREPQLVFLDIHMPELDGLAMLASLPEDKRPLVVFVTAFDQYAVEAFDLHALDYVLKPFDERRLERSVERARRALARLEPRDFESRVLAVLQTLEVGRKASPYLTRIPLRSDDRVTFQPVKDIDWFKAEGKHVRVHAGDASTVVRESIGQLERDLDPAKFLRISRSAIVNVERIRELQPWFNGAYLVILRNGHKVTSTRGYRDNLKRLLEGY